MKKLKLKMKKLGMNFCTSRQTKILYYNFSFFNFHFSFHQRKASGFTLMEMVVALGIFSSIMLMSIGALVSVQDAQIRSSDVQIVQDNIRFALELMTKEIRQGSEYEGDDCSSSACGEIRFVRMTPQGEVTFGYCVDGGKLIRFIVSAPQSQDCSSGAILTAEEVTVEGLLFYILGQDPDPSDGQARVTIAMRVRAQSPSQKVESVMDLQTTIVQRLREG